MATSGERQTAEPERLRRAIEAAGRRRPVADFVLATVNAPRPKPIDAPTLLACLFSPQPVPAWRPHIAAFFDETSPEALHDLVLAGIVDFTDLRDALHVWSLEDARNAPWIEEMAALGLARDAARDRAGASGSAR